MNIPYGSRIFLEGKRMVLLVLSTFVVFYERCFYLPLQTVLSPFVKLIPRTATILGKERTIFSANLITIGRTFLVIPIVLCLKYSFNWVAFTLMFWEDLLDHLDGVVAKIHKQLGYQDDPHLGPFLDALCDKIVNCIVLYTIFIVADLEAMTNLRMLLLVSCCFLMLGYEVILGMVRVCDYFAAQSGEIRVLEASMQGKLKEKLESFGIALLCLSSPNSTGTFAENLGVIFILCSVLFAHSSLMEKLRRNKWVSESGDKKERTFDEKSIDNDQFAEHDKYDRVYTIGCFDLLHRGHRNLFRTMRSIGRTVIVGVHSDESIFKLKGKWPIDKLEKRMAKVKEYADFVFAIPGTDPTPYIMSATNGSNSIFVRGDDMPNFPSRGEVEKHMEIRLIPYTTGVSSTLLRQQLQEKGEVPQEAQ